MPGATLDMCGVTSRHIRSQLTCTGHLWMHGDSQHIRGHLWIHSRHARGHRYGRVCVCGMHQEPLMVCTLRGAATTPPVPCPTSHNDSGRRKRAAAASLTPTPVDMGVKHGSGEGWHPQPSQRLARHLHGSIWPARGRERRGCDATLIFSHA